MAVTLSKRAQVLKPSPTLALSARAKELHAQGKPVINLSVGEPDWNTSEVACNAAIQTIQSGFTKYTPAAGIIELRQEIARITSEELGIPFAAANVAVGTGAKFILAALMQILINENDQVLIPTPYWVSYPTMVELAGGVPVTLECGQNQGFKLLPEQLARAINPKTKALILCSPSNPTGLMYTRAELQALANVIRKNPNLCVVTDDIYNHLLFSDEPIAPHLLQVAPDLLPQTIVVNGASKTFSMTGWRVGWSLASLEITRVLSDYMSQTTSNVTSISQKAVLEALKNQSAEVERARTQIKARAQKGAALLRGVPGLQIFEPQGAFYFWVGVEGWMKSGKLAGGSKEISKRLLEEQFLAVVPGLEFGAEGFLRLSFAVSESEFAEAVDRMKKFASSI